MLRDKDTLNVMWRKKDLNKALLYQKPSVRNEDEDTEEMLDFDEDAYLKEQEEKRRQKLKRYESSLGFLLKQASEKGEISLSDIWKNIQENEKNAEEMQHIEVRMNACW